MRYYRIDTSKLKPGDVVFFTNPSLPGGVVSLLVRFADSVCHWRFRRFSEYSHVALHLDRGILIEATKERGVALSTLMPVHIFSVRWVSVKRPGSGFETDTSRVAQLHKITDLVNPYLFKGYDMLGAALSLWPPLASAKERFRPSDKYFCSRLVGHIFSEIGYPLVEAGDEAITPLMLFKSDKLEGPLQGILTPTSMNFMTFMSHSFRRWYGPNRPSAFESLQNELRSLMADPRRHTSRFVEKLEDIVREHQALTQSIATSLDALRDVTIRLPKEVRADFRCYLLDMIHAITNDIDRLGKATADEKAIATELRKNLEKVRRYSNLTPEQRRELATENINSLRGKGMDEGEIQQAAREAERLARNPEKLADLVTCFERQTSQKDRIIRALDELSAQWARQLCTWKTAVDIISRADESRND